MLSTHMVVKEYSQWVSCASRFGLSGPCFKDSSGRVADEKQAPIHWKVGSLWEKLNTTASGTTTQNDRNIPVTQPLIQQPN